MSVYIVIMYRWGNTEEHSYIKGIYSEYENAITNAENERENRGFKYEYKILYWKIDEIKGKEIASSIL